MIPKVYSWPWWYLAIPPQYLSPWRCQWWSKLWFLWSCQFLIARAYNSAHSLQRSCIYLLLKSFVVVQILGIRIEGIKWPHPYLKTTVLHKTKSKSGFFFLYKKIHKSFLLPSSSDKELVQRYQTNLIWSCWSWEGATDSQSDTAIPANCHTFFF